MSTKHTCEFTDSQGKKKTVMALLLFLEFLLELNARETDGPIYQKRQSASLLFISRRNSRNNNMKSIFKTYLTKDQISFLLLFSDWNLMLNPIFVTIFLWRAHVAWFTPHKSCFCLLYRKANELIKMRKFSSRDSDPGRIVQVSGWE